MAQTNIELIVGAIYKFGRKKTRGFTKGNSRYKDAQTCGGRYDFAGAKMKYLGQTGAGYLFQSVQNEWNKGCYSAFELEERGVTLA